MSAASSSVGPLKTVEIIYANGDVRTFPKVVRVFHDAEKQIIKLYFSHDVRTFNSAVSYTETADTTTTTNGDVLPALEAVTEDDLAWMRLHNIKCKCGTTPEMMNTKKGDNYNRKYMRCAANQCESYSFVDKFKEAGNKWPATFKKGKW